MARRYPWFRLYSELYTDPKMLKITAQEFRTFIYLLCYANEQDTRGEILYDDIEMLALKVSHDDTGLLEDTITKLSKLRIVTTGNELGFDTIAFSNFNKRQTASLYESDKPEAVNERVKKSRENVTNCNDSKRTVTSSNERKRVDKIREDKRREEKRREEIIEEKEPSCAIALEIQAPERDECRLFYDKYPRHVAYANVVKAWDKGKKLKRPPFDELMQILDEHIAMWKYQKKELGLIPLPATWLNQQRWCDEVRVR